MKHYTREHNYNERNIIIAFNSNELKDFAYGKQEEVLTIKEMVALKDKEDEEKAKAIEETIRLMEEEERENEGLYECLSRIEKRVNTILAKGENLTIEDVARVVSELDFYSDIYKDVNGIRPHWYMERVWKAMKTFAPNTIAEVQKMDENGTWWDFVCNIK
jgi:hypothetical protein